MTPRPIRFLHRGQVVEVSDAAPTRTVLEWLREDAHCTGTKEGCAEGDCGACTVVVGELAGEGAEEGSLQLRPVNACIQFLPTLDGKALFAVEDVALADGSLHPVQQCLVAQHGSQCGFCTPGFVMSLWAGYENRQQVGQVPSRQQLADELSGNLCRCTGYRPILDAAEAAYALPPVHLDRAPVVAALRALRAAPPLHYQAPGHAAFHAPRTLDALAALREAQPQARLLAGGTDVGLWVTKQFKDLGPLISIGQVEELRRVATTETHFHIGAAVTLEAAWQALAIEWPSLRDVWLRFASLPIRHAGTLGGNVANGSPIGDAAPVLIALGASLVLRRGAATRRMALEDFYLDYMKNRLEPGEFVQALEVPRRGARAQPLRVYKISKRFDCDISAVCAALALELDGDVVTEARIAFGGMAATVRRAPQAETALRGQPWNGATLSLAMDALARDYAPLSDLRASAGYRLQVAQNLLRRFWLETRLDEPLRESAVSVFAREATP